MRQAECFRCLETPHLSALLLVQHILSMLRSAVRLLPYPLYIGKSFPPHSPPFQFTHPLVMCLWVQQPDTIRYFLLVIAESETIGAGLNKSVGEILCGGMCYLVMHSCQASLSLAFPRDFCSLIHRTPMQTTNSELRL